jgi:threonine/homoserine/homoserine lactone efflux protein
MPVTTEHLLGFALAALVIIAIPGPSVLFIVGRALSYGRGVALLTVAGNTAGLALVMTLVAFGLGALVAESVTVFTVLKLAGAAYLVWLGVQAIRHGRFTDPDGAGEPPALSRTTVLRQGFTVGATNPKAFAMAAAVLPQFVTRETGHVTAQMLVLGGIAVTIGLLSDGLWAVIASRLREWFASSPAHGRRLSLVGGTSIIGLGVALATTGRPE